MIALSATRPETGTQSGSVSRMAAAFLSILLLATAATAALKESDVLQGNLDALAEAQASASAAERLLVASLLAEDPVEALSGARRALQLPAEDWLHREALRRLMDAWCITNQADSLAAWRARFETLAGEPYACVGVPEETRPWWVQVGAFSSLENARRSLSGLDSRGVPIRVLREGSLYRALAGGYASKREAKRAGGDWQERGWITDYSTKKLP